MFTCSSTSSLESFVDDSKLFLSFVRDIHIIIYIIIYIMDIYIILKLFRTQRRSLCFCLLPASDEFTIRLITESYTSTLFVAKDCFGLPPTEILAMVWVKQHN
jgi:hypothetical protein